jgi:hypothetical protein
MAVVRRILAALGLMAVVLGVAVMFEPELARLLPGSQTFLLAIVAGAGILAYVVVRERRDTPIRTAETPDPETEQDLAVPGDDFTELLATADPAAGPATPVRRGGASASQRVRERLETAATETIVRKWGCPEAVAVEALAEGTWTDDPHAAAFFTGDLEGVPLRRRVRLALGTEPRFERQARAAAEAIAALSAAEEVDGPDEVVGT